MRRFLALAGVLCLGAAMPAAGQDAPEAFKDVPRDHWAYEAVESLRSQGILIGYPDGYFRGKRTLTRYEFAVALDRALRRVITPRGEQGGQPGPQGPRGAPGEPGPAGPQGPPGVRPQELDTLQRLTQEFRNELTSIGTNLQTVNRRLDELAREMAALREKVDRLPTIGGNVFTGFRSDNANGNYVDHDGRVNPLGTRQAFTHQFRLTLDANIPGGGTVNSALTLGNYKNYLGGNLAQISPRPQGLNFGPVGGHSSGTLSSTVPADTYLDLLEVRTPFEGIGRGSNLTFGRFAHRVGRLTLWRPDVDSYFNVPWLEDGNYRIDGARLTTNLGSLSFEGFAGKFDSVQGSNGGPFNSPLAGTAASAPGVGVFSFQAKPIGQPVLGQGTATQLAGVSLGIGVTQLQGGHVRATAMDVATPGAPGYSGVQVLGADLDLRLIDRLSLTADWGKTITRTGRTNTANPHFNNAFNAALAYGSGRLTLSAGYRYIDPNFYAPGYWGRIGNWLNPTNIQGPTVRAALDISSRLRVNVGGDFFTAARNRFTTGGLSRDDHIGRILAGVKWDVSERLFTSVDWEGVFWEIEGPHSGGLSVTGNPRVHPTEHYVTFGTGYSLTNNAILKLMYQVGAFDGHNLLLNAPGVGPKNNFGVFAGQVAVKF